MCSHYESVKNHNLLKPHFGIDSVPDGINPSIRPLCRLLMKLPGKR